MGLNVNTALLFFFLTVFALAVLLYQAWQNITKQHELDMLAKDAIISQLNLAVAEQKQATEDCVNEINAERIACDAHGLSRLELIHRMREAGQIRDGD